MFAIATNKCCKRTVRIEVTREEPTKIWRHSSGQGFKLDNGWLVPLGSYHDVCFCGCKSKQYNGQQQWSFRAVIGRIKENHKCDARCLNSKGHSCECACGGKNHGAGHSE